MSEAYSSVSGNTVPPIIPNGNNRGDVRPTTPRRTVTNRNLEGQNLTDETLQQGTEESGSASPGGRTSIWRTFKWIAWDSHPTPKAPPLNANSPTYAKDFFNRLSPNRTALAFAQGDISSSTSDGKAATITMPTKTAAPNGWRDTIRNFLIDVELYRAWIFDGLDYWVPKLIVIVEYLLPLLLSLALPSNILSPLRQSVYTILKNVTSFSLKLGTSLLNTLSRFIFVGTILGFASIPAVN